MDVELSGALEIREPDRDPVTRWVPVGRYPANTAMMLADELKRRGYETHLLTLKK